MIPPGAFGRYAFSGDGAMWVRVFNHRIGSCRFCGGPIDRTDFEGRIEAVPFCDITCMMDQAAKEGR